MIVIIGGTNIDIVGHARDTFSYATSNIGDIVYTPGGVSSNIAHNLANLDIPVTLLSAVGNDYYGKLLIKNNSSLGIDMSNVLVKDNASTGTYLAILDNMGELISAICNADILNYIDIAYIDSKIDIIKKASFLVCDTNIPKESIEYLVDIAKKHSIPIIIEPVSCIKSKKILDTLDGVYMITPNFDELRTLNNINNINDSDENIIKLSKNLINLGVENVVVTCGARGVCLVNSSDAVFLDSIKTDIVNVTGAGDSLVSGILYGLHNNYSIIDSIKYGICAATITIQSKDTVSDALNKEAIRTLREYMQ